MEMYNVPVLSVHCSLFLCVLELPSSIDKIRNTNVIYTAMRQFKLIKSNEKRKSILSYLLAHNVGGAPLGVRGAAVCHRLGR